MAELLLLLPEYMAARIDHARQDVGDRKEKLLQRSCSFLMPIEQAETGASGSSQTPELGREGLIDGLKA